MSEKAKLLNNYSNGHANGQTYGSLKTSNDRLPM